MCISDITIARPQLSDAIPMAERLSSLGDRLTDPMDIATAHAAAATLRHVHELVIGDGSCSIDDNTRRVVIATLTGLRALAHTEAAAGSNVWTRAILLIDNAIEEIEQ